MQNQRTPTQNLLLASLPSNELVRLIPLLQPMALPRGAVVYSIGDPVDFIYFPSGEMKAGVATLDDAQGMEVLPIGREGAIGVGALSGMRTSAYDVAVQMTGAVWRIGVVDLKRALQYCPVLQNRLGQYFSVWLTQTLQSAACADPRGVAPRCAGKALESGSRDPSLLHEVITMATGVRRAGITNLVATPRNGGVSVLRAIRSRSLIGD